MAGAGLALIVVGVCCPRAARAGDHRRECYVGFRNEVPWIPRYFAGQNERIEQSIRTGVASKCQDNPFLKWWKFVAIDPQHGEQFPQLRLVLYDAGGLWMRIELFDKQGREVPSYRFDLNSLDTPGLDLNKAIPGFENDIADEIHGLPDISKLDVDLPNWFASAFFGPSCRLGQEVLEKICQSIPVGEVLVLPNPTEQTGRLLLDYANISDHANSYFWVHCEQVEGTVPTAGVLLTSVGRNECRIVERNGQRIHSLVLEHKKFNEDPIQTVPPGRLAQLRAVECVLAKPVYVTNSLRLPCYP